MYRPALHNEQEVLSGFSSGDRQAFETLYRNRYLPLFHFVKRYVDDQQAAEDITTETFLKLWQRRAEFGVLRQLDAFLYTSARNACLNYLRDERRHWAKQKQLLAAAEMDEQPDLAEQEIAVRVYQYIYAEIARLPATMQQVLRLHLGGVKNEAIARELGIAEKTVRNLKSEAIKILKIRLSHQEFALLQLLLVGVCTGIC